MNPEFKPEIGQATQFSSENQPANNGRKRNVFKETQKDYELSLDDMRQMMTDLLSLDPDQLKEIVQDKSVPVFKVVIASAIMKSIKEGNWTQVNYMADRLFGKATEKHELTGADGSFIKIIVEGVSPEPDSDKNPSS